MDKENRYIKKEIITIAVSLIIGFAVSIGFAINSYAQKVSRDITDSVIRFHVIAQDNTDEEQILKLKVRDAVLKMLHEEMSSMNNRYEAEEYLAGHLEDISLTAERVLENEGFDYDVNTELTVEHYPVRYYKGASFPEGDYKSLKVIIGNGEGRNWWCVMYPPLCLNGEGVEYKDTDMLKTVLSEDGYDVVVLSSEETVPELKFKIVEWWNSL